MKIIFLDIDGVLNSDEYFDKIKNLNIEGIQNKVEVEKIKLLKQAIDITGAKVVLTSSWRYRTNAKYLKELLLEYDIIPDSTPYLNNRRGLEIKEWLEEHSDIENFVILDDEVSSTYDEYLLERLIKISNGNGGNFGEGLQEKDVKEIVKRLGEIK